MPFSSKLREWYLRAFGDGEVSNAQCQKVTYFERGGFRQVCQERGKGLYVVRWTVQEMGTVGLPLCRRHFMELVGGNPYGKRSSSYPELAKARREYKDDRTSFDKLEPFSETHRTRAGDWGSDEYYFELATQKILKYELAHPEDPKPADMPHRRSRWMEISERY